MKGGERATMGSTTKHQELLDTLGPPILRVCVMRAGADGPEKRTQKLSEFLHQNGGVGKHWEQLANRLMYERARSATRRFMHPEMR